MNFQKWVKSIQTAGYNGARKLLYFLEMCPIFVGSFGNFGRSDKLPDVVKSAYFHYMHMWFHVQLTRTILNGVYSGWQ